MVVSKYCVTAPNNSTIKSPRTVTEDYKVIEDIGTGTDGCVKKVLYTPLNEYRVFKKITDNKAQTHVEILAAINHPNVIKIYDSFAEDDDIFLVLEYCPGGELFDRIIEKGRLCEREAASITIQILKAVEACHEEGVAHRDVKLENIALMDKSEEAVVKLLDFGSACRFKNCMRSEKPLMVSRTGTPFYVAPEVLKDEPYCEKVDCWSIGVIMFMLLSGYPPFNGETDIVILKKVQRGEPFWDQSIWRGISPEATNLVKLLLEPNPKKRISAQNAVEHEWFKQVYGENTKHACSDMYTKHV